MDRRGFKLADAAAYFGWDQTFISKLLNGHRSPGLTNALHIERHTGIPCEAWESSELDKSKKPVTIKVGKHR